MLAGLAGAVPAPARAARPFVVDDARVVDEGACQVESWTKRNGSLGELWMQPACNVRGVELAAGAGFLRDDTPGNRAERDYQFQAKLLGRPLQPGDWGWGVAAGVVRHADINLAQNLIGNTYVFAPVSFSLLQDRLVLLTNLGLIDSRDLNRRGMSYGVGAEVYATPRLVLLGEAYGATGFDRFSQLGVRWWILPERLQVDGSWGTQLNGSVRAEWFTLGLRFITHRLF